ncbi:MAG: EscU/YscU/HrcU family type III secretion system export apparatus switch protein [Spirochaetaceae bacterium]|nr:EscU/YscU/HrcU family type III secretion system export apparatus switch protein [Spirochaetaceae bacterium]
MGQKKAAVALCYPDGYAAPFILAKGKGLLAERITDIALEHDIQIVADPRLSNILSVYEIGSCIPPETYEAVAGIFAFLEKWRGGIYSASD